MLRFLYVYSDHSILECYNLFSGVELSMRSFFVINRVYLEIFKNKTKLPCIQTLAGVTVEGFLSETIILISYVDQRTSKIVVCVVAGSSCKRQEHPS